MLLVAEKISKSYLEKSIIHDVTFGIGEGDKIGIIGVNGTGKSTLLKILAGLDSPDSGMVIRSNGVQIGFLPQNPEIDSNSSVLDYALQGLPEKDRDTKAYECKTILTKLGITEFERPISLLSGGQKKRVSIASALVSNAQILILDEPTNHIDNEMVTWLEQYLASYRGALVMVTHDRYFLDRVTNKIAELSNGSLYLYEANYSQYLERKLERAEMETSRERKRQALLKKELAWIQRGARARGTKQKFRVERYEMLSGQSAPSKENSLKIESLSSRLGKKIISVEHISKSYGEKLLISDFSYTLLRDDRIGIVGPNGCGKTTLLKMVTGLTSPDSGSVTIGETVRIGYFSQENDEMDLQQRAIDYIKDISQWIEMPDGTWSASQLMERFLFPADLQYTPIGRLSGGERRRLFLLGVLISAPNILLLDEPTNDLDIETLTVLEDYLDSFAGAVIAVSHDRYFLDRIAHHIFAFEPGGDIKAYVGGYSDYLKLRPEQKTPKTPVSKAAAQKPRQNTKLKFTFREQQEYQQIDEMIASLEQQISDLDQQIQTHCSDFSTLSDLMKQKEDLENSLNHQMERWVYLNELAEKIEAQNKKQQ